MTLAELGKQVAAWRRQKNMTQRDFCVSAGISRATLSALENGEVPELGYNKVQRLLQCVSKELAVRDASPVLTFDELLRANRQEQADPSAPAPGEL